MLRINLGSGQRKFEKPWTNVDCQEKWSPDVVADGAHMSMFPDNSAEMIVLHHVYEHFGLGEADAMVRECYRILAPGGSLILTIPNLRALVRGWLTGVIDEYLFCVNIYGAYMGNEADRHKFGYTTEGLIKAITATAPWRSVWEFDFRPIEGASICADWWIGGCEAIK